MRFRRLVRFSVPMLAVAICALGLTWGDDVVVEEEATAAYPLGDELLIHLVTVDGVRIQTVSTVGGTHAVEYRRTLATTVPWTNDSADDESLSYYKVIPGEQGSSPTKTCCNFSCSAETYNFAVGGNGRCSGYGDSCRVCIAACTTDNSVCSRVGKVIAVID